MQIDDIRTNHETDSSVWKGVVAGLAGGLVASLAMSQFQTLWSKAGEALTERKGQSGQDSQNQQKSESKQDQEDPTMKAAEKMAKPVLGRHLTKEEKKSAGPIIHYAFGALMGGTYGLAGELAPITRSLFGLPYGAALFVAADEVAVPALGLSKPPSQTPASSHLYGLASHLVYAATLETVRRNVRRIL